MCQPLLLFILFLQIPVWLISTPGEAACMFQGGGKGASWSLLWQFCRVLQSLSMAHLFNSIELWHRVCMESLLKIKAYSNWNILTSSPQFFANFIFPFPLIRTDHFFSAAHLMLTCIFSCQSVKSLWERNLSAPVSRQRYCLSRRALNKMYLKKGSAFSTSF